MATSRIIAGRSALHQHRFQQGVDRVDYKGKSITFSGDIDAHAHTALTQLAKGCNVLVFNAPVLDPPHSPPALYALHTAPGDIGKISAAAQVSRTGLDRYVPKGFVSVCIRTLDRYADRDFRAFRHTSPIHPSV